MKITLSQPYSFCQPGKRDNQEDARFPDCDVPPHPLPFFLVCDGVGGHEKGEIASRTVCQAFARHLGRFDWTGDFSLKDFSQALDYAYSSLYKAMRKETKEMATTLTFVCFHSQGATAAHIGDSRIYHIRPQVGILYRSDDHSLVNALVHSGNLTPQEAENHPQGNYITRCMGYVGPDEERSGATVLQIADIEAGDYFLLCTDGVLHQVEEEKLVETLSGPLSDAEKSKQLAAWSKDSIDNNTAYLIPVKEVAKEEEEEAAETTATQPAKETLSLRLREIAVEVVSAGTPSVKDKVTGFLKKLFQ